MRNGLRTRFLPSLALLLAWFMVQRCDGFVLFRRSNGACDVLPSAAQLPTCYRLYDSNDSNNNNGGDENNEKPKSYTSRELYEKEVQENRRVMDNLLLPKRLNDAVTTTAYAFVFVAIVLNLFEYDFRVKDGMLTIDTLENRQFENEVRRSMRTTKTLPGSVEGSDGSTS